MIHVTDVHVSFDAPVLDGVSFRVDRGHVAALVGPNGAGKTTMLRVLAGLAAPEAGAARIDGVDVTTDRRAAQRRLAFLPQDTRFHGALTPRQVLRFYAGVRACPDAPIDALLDDVDLTDAAHRPCDALSGGMRQRLGLAVVQLAPVPVWLLDEPGLSLDPDWRTYLRRAIRRHADDGGTVLMATHLPELWGEAVDATLVCEDGRIRPATGDGTAPTDASGAVVGR